jgi:hypothetical protein
MRYKCCAPECTYQTDHRSQIHIHHIVPRSMGGSNKSFNLLEVCPNCHSRIFVPGATSGIHSKQHDNSFVITRVVLGTSGRLIEYIDCDGDGDIKYHEI